jgi:hypothetical protein
MRLFGGLILVIGLFMALVLPVHAQETPFDSATLTEAFINAQIQAHQQPGSELTNLYIDLQPGLIVISGTTTGNQGALELSLSLAPSVTNGRLDLQATAITIGGLELDLTQWTQSGGGADTADDLQALISGSAQGGQLESIVVTDSDLTVTWRRADPNAPALALVDNALSLTATESYVNSLPAMTNPANPDLSDLHMDFQPGQATFTATRTLADGSQVPVTITFVATVYNGLATWSVQAMIVGDTPADDLEVGQVNDDIVGSWRVFFNGLYRSGQLESIVLTDTTITLTWDADLQSPIAFDPASGSLVVTEDAINASYRVTNPISYTISNVIVDLQPGQVVITADLNLANGRVLAERITFVPSVNNGVIEWTVTTATLDGEPLDPEIIARFNETLARWWDTIMWRSMGDYMVTSVTVSDTEITITARSR